MTFDTDLQYVRNTVCIFSQASVGCAAQLFTLTVLLIMEPRESFPVPSTSAGGSANESVQIEETEEEVSVALSQKGNLWPHLDTFF